MNSNYIGILVGGIIPAIIFGIGGVFVKASNQQGISVNYYLFIAGLGAVILSLISFFVFEEKTVNFKSGTSAFVVGLTWIAGILLVAFALKKYNTPISIISALNCTACLVTILLSFVIFSEWKETHILRLLIGSIMIVVGAMLVSTSLTGNTNEQVELVKDCENRLP